MSEEPSPAGPPADPPSRADEHPWWTRPLPTQHRASTHIGTWDLDLTTGQAAWSDEEYRLLGYAPGAVTPGVEPFMEAVHPEDREAVSAEMERAMDPGAPQPYHVEHRAVWPDGSVHHLDQRARVLFSDDGRPLRMVGSTLDVTERHATEAFLRHLANLLTRRLHGQARNLADLMQQVDEALTERLAVERELKLSERKLRTLMESAGDAILLTGRETGVIVEANLAAGELFGRPAAEMIGMPQEKLYPPDLEGGYRRHFREHLEEEARTTAPVVVQRADGARIPVEVSSSRVELGGQSFALGIFRDLSEHQRTQRELNRRGDTLEAVARLSREFLRAERWEDVIGLGLALLGEATGVSRSYLFRIHWAEAEGPALCSMSHEWCAAGVQPQIGNTASQRFDFLAGGVDDWVHRLAAGTPVARRRREYSPAEAAVLGAQDIESVLMVPVFLGSALWGFLGFDDCRGERNWSGPEVAALESAAGVLGAAIERQSINRRLEERERRYAMATEAGQVGVWEWDPETNWLEGDAVLRRMLEMPVGPTGGDLSRWLERVEPADAEQVLALAGAIRSGENPVIDLDLRVRAPPGEVRWLAVRSESPEPRGPAPGRIYGSAVNITDRRRVQDYLRQANRAWSETFNTVPDPLALVGRDHRLIQANRALADRLGMALSTLPGQDWYALVYGDPAPPPDCPLQAMLEDGARHSAEFAHTRLGGYFRFTAAPLLDAQGQIRGSVCIALDLTERERAEKERLALAEQQRDALVREVHHRIKNHLQGLIGLLRLGEVNERGGPLVLGQAVGQVESIAAVYGLQSRRSRGDVSFRQTLAAIVASARNLHAAPIVLEGEAGDADASVDGDKAVSLALTVNELLMNAAKHCTEVPRGVRVTCDCSTQARIVLRVCNPGRLPEGFDFAAGRGLSTGLGLLRDLLPRRGASLDIHQEADGVVAELTLTPPLVLEEAPGPNGP